MNVVISYTFCVGVFFSPLILCISYPEFAKPVAQIEGDDKHKISAS